ncbi:CNNM domain-containing protein [Flavobacteriaceae bacterium]|nr:CNNM domain-containing protein [Flavobacteriaceae bacterium]
MLAVLRLRYIALKKGKKGKRITKLFSNRDNTVSTILMCNNLVNILSASIATGVLIEIFGHKGILFATIIMTFLILIFGEIIPKTYALQNPEKSVLKAATFLWIALIIFSPIVGRVQKMVNAILSLFGVGKEQKHQKQIADIDEIRGTIEIKHQEGSIVKSDKDMIGGVLDLEKIQISEIMTHRQDIDSINIDQDVEKIIQQALKIGHSNIPLWRDDEDNIVKVIRMQRLHRLSAGDKKLSQQQLESTFIEPWFVPESNSLRNQMLLFRKSKKQFAIVIDEYGALMGVVTLHNILEQIIGVFEEEDGSNLQQIVHLKDGNYQIAGDASIRYLNRQLGWELPENSEQPNIGAMIFSKTEKLPKKDEKIVIGDLIFKIIKVKSNKIISLKVLKNDKKNQQG